MASLPYSNCSSGDKAMGDIQKTLSKFGCQSFGSMMDFENKELIVQFKYRDIPISVKASVKGYAARWLEENPWNSRRRASRVDWEREALRIAGIAVYSILRDWIKGQVTAVECGILSFEGAFLGQILLPSGQTVFEKVVSDKLLLAAPKTK